MSSLPLRLTFHSEYIYQHTNSTRLLSDPTAFEEPLLDTTLSIIIDQDDHLISVTQLGLGLENIRGEEEIQDSLLNICISTAIMRRKELLVQFI